MHSEQQFYHIGSTLKYKDLLETYRRYNAIFSFWLSLYITSAVMPKHSILLYNTKVVIQYPISNKNCTFETVNFSKKSCTFETVYSLNKNCTFETVKFRLLRNFSYTVFHLYGTRSGCKPKHKLSKWFSLTPSTTATNFFSA